ncbi:hypothetical protein [Pedobacter nutrimenti]|nr:hypothetical protein [Pedobacter nutrimenti]
MDFVPGMQFGKKAAAGLSFNQSGYFNHLYLQVAAHELGYKTIGKLVS